MQVRTFGQVLPLTWKEMEKPGGFWVQGEGDSVGFTLSRVSVGVGRPAAGEQPGKGQECSGSRAAQVRPGQMGTRERTRQVSLGA